MSDALTINEIKALGYERGWNIASWQDMPEIGTEIPKHVDWLGIGVISSVNDQIDAWEMLISESESNDRCYSPFEFTASAINARDEKYGEGAASEGWNAFDNAIEKGVRAYRRKHYPLWRMRREAKNAD